jgi:hypothetical protein
MKAGYFTCDEEKPDVFSPRIREYHQAPRRLASAGQSEIDRISLPIGPSADG